MKRYFLVFFAVILFAGSPYAKEEKPRLSVKAEISSAFITIGDPVKYTITVKRDPSIELLSLFPVPPRDIFHIKKIDEFNREEDGLKVEGRTIVLTAFRLGEFIIPPVKIDYRDSGGAVQSVETQKIYLTVKSVAEGEEKQDIRGLKTVLEVESRWVKTTAWITGLIVAAWVVFFIYRRLRKKAQEESLNGPALTPEQWAFSELNKLYDSDFLRQGKVKKYYLRLSEILRTYFENRFQILAVESTTDEILTNLKKREIEPGLRNKIAEVLQAADLAKFAKWIPEPVEIIQINKKAKEVVEEASPREAAGVKSGV